MSTELSQGIVKRMGDTQLPATDDLWTQSPTLQVVMLKDIVSNKSGQQSNRKRGAVSDGLHYIQVMFTTQLNDLIDQGKISRYTVIKVKKMTLNVMQEKRLIVLLEVDVVQQMDRKIGNPTAADGKTSNEIEADVGMDLPAPAAGSSSAATRVVPAQITPKPVHTPAQSSASAGASKSSVSLGHIFPIEGLSPYQNKWTIKARVTNKSEIKTWANQKGDGKLFSVTFMDETGDIRATGFNKTVDQLYQKFEVNKVYFVTKARVVVAKKKFSHLDNEYEITLEPTTEVEEATDDSNVPVQKYNFTPLNALESLQKDAVCDVIGVVKDVGEVVKLQSKAGRDMIKREVTLVDQSGMSVRLTLWGQQAESFNHTDQPVIAFKNVKVSDFGGRTLSLLGSGSMAVNPDMDMGNKLRGWFDSQGNTMAFNNYSSANGMSGGGDAGGAISRNEMMALQDVRESETLGREGGKEFFACKATVMHIRVPGEGRTAWYTACPACNKKVVEMNEKWTCEKCNKTLEAPAYRYMLSVAFADNTAQAWFTAFNEAGQTIVGKSADELQKDDSELDTVFKNAVGKTFLISCRVKQDTYNDEPRMRYSISKIQPVDYCTEAEALAQLIASYPKE